jgi:hypothetical protein
MSIHNKATVATMPWGHRHVTMMGLPAGTEFHRIFRYPGADWNAPPEAYRNGRIDPPPGRKAEFSILYTAESVLTAAVEARVFRVLEIGGRERLELVEVCDPDLPVCQMVVHTLVSPALFIDLEHRQTAQAFGLDPDMVLDRIDAWQQASAAVWDALSAEPPRTIAEIAGVCYQSKHRASNGWNFGFFHGRHADFLHRGAAKPFKLDTP